MRGLKSTSLKQLFGELNVRTELAILIRRPCP
jgi:hypothetical protein